MLSFRSIVLVILVAQIGSPSAVSADPLVGDSERPGRITFVQKELDGSLTFEIAEGADRPSIVSQVQQHFPSAEIRLRGSTLVIAALSDPDAGLAKLREHTAYEGLDGVDAFLAQMRDRSAGSGSSIRASRPAEVAMVEDEPSPLPHGRKLVGRIVEVKRFRFPWVILSVSSEAVRDNKTPGSRPSFSGVFKVVPRLKFQKGSLRLDDEQTTENLAAWYLQRGDTVTFSLEKAAGKDKDIVVAQKIARQLEKKNE